MDKRNKHQTSFNPQMKESSDLCTSQKTT